MAKKSLSVGDVVTGTALAKAYNAYVVEVLRGSLEAQDRTKGTHRKYKIVKTLPSAEEYKKLLAAKYTVTVHSLIEDAYSRAEDLASEVRDAYDNMPENLQNGDRGTRLDEAASSCEEVANDQPDLPDRTKSLSIVYFPDLKANSRSERASEIGDMLTLAAEAVRDYITTPDESEPLSEKDESSLEELADHLETASATIQDVDFPGMYG